MTPITKVYVKESKMATRDQYYKRTLKFDQPNCGKWLPERLSVGSSHRCWMVMKGRENWGFNWSALPTFSTKVSLGPLAMMCIRGAMHVRRLTEQTGSCRE